MGLSGGVQAEQGFRLKKGSHLALPPPHLVSLPKNGREIAGAALRVVRQSGGLAELIALEPPQLR
jgi:hypothetical protein